MKRGRNQRRRQGVNPNRALDSNGPDVRIRGTANQIYDKYVALARDATSSGDRVKAENYLQHAEHYYRVIRTMQPDRPVQSEGDNDSQNDMDDDNDRGHDRNNDRDRGDRDQNQNRRARSNDNRSHDNGDNESRPRRENNRNNRNGNGSEEENSSDDIGREPEDLASSRQPDIQGGDVEASAGPGEDRKPKRKRKPRVPKSEATEPTEAAVVAD